MVIRSRRAVLPEGETAAAVAVQEGRIAAVGPYGGAVSGREEIDLGDTALLPGLVDTHVHVNEPGRTEWEGFATATRAAAAGGVTTIIDMPLNSIPPTVDVAALETKRAVAAPQVFVDVGFWGGAIPGNLPNLRPLHAAGVYGFKCFMSPSGVDEFPPLSHMGLHEAMTEIASFGGLLIVHAEDAAYLEEPASGAYRDFLLSRPPVGEFAAVRRAVKYAAETGVRLHILHVSAADALAAVARAQAQGLPVTAETCPHYLTLTDSEASSTAYKCCPPIRDEANRDELWKALASGVIGCVVSDHSPCEPALKEGDFATAWGGVSSLQLGLPVVWTAARERGHSLADVVSWMAYGPAELAGLTRKGRIEAGRDADLVAFDPDAGFVVDPSALNHRHPVTPYAGRALTGVVRTTWLRGEPVGDRPAGRLLTRGEV
ncbi:allantoinase AllB [Bailinhaonella thermotolerans]|uniref:allantoinase AllB n=1 Tax=Bailinhaonella thermotolerans TaxID=1070861 RepID=UPI001F5BD142|nr:allantoinase AllB [Bailinhaonella thermotolerans]